MHTDRTVRPRWVWAGMIAALVGAAALGLGITRWSLAPVVVGAVLLAAGAAAAIRGGILYDTHSGRPLRAELSDVGHDQGHQGTSPGDMVDDSRARQDARATTSQTDARLAGAGEAPSRASMLRPGAGLLLVGAVFVLCAQGLYAHTPLGQENAVRDLGLAVVAGLAGLRLLVGNRPGRGWSLVAGCCGLALLALAVLTPHDARSGVLVEAVGGAWVVVAAGLSLDRRTRGSVVAPGRHG